MAEIHFLTLDLFYYYLRQGFDITDEEVKHFDDCWKVYEEKYSEKDGYLELVHENFQGKLYHIKKELEDTNLILLDCSTKVGSKPVEPDFISKLKAQINPPVDNKVSLGYTWMIYGHGKFNEDVLKTLYNKLIGGDWSFHRKGKILGATIVEAWQSNREWDVPEKGTHVLITLYPDQATYENASKLISENWLTLLWYRHKIWYSYKESRVSKEKSLKAFNEAVKDLKSYKKDDLADLNKSLEDNLDNLTSYSINLNNIGIHQHTLSTNLYNYNLAIVDFLKTPNNDLKFLKEFSEIAEIKYEKQLEKDYATLAPGLAVLTGLTETIRGLVEVQQAEIDQQQNITIAIVGLGLSASSAAVGISATQVYQPENNQRISWQEGLGYSLAPVIVIGISLILVSTKDWYKNFMKLKQAESTKLSSSKAELQKSEQGEGAIKFIGKKD